MDNDRSIGYCPFQICIFRRPYSANGGRIAELLCYIAIFILSFQCTTSAIKCKKCEQKFDSCDIGECTGQSCVTIEASNAQSKIVVKKMCSKDKVQKTECFITFPDGIESIQCQCAYDFCNADRELAKIGLKVPVGGGPNVGRNDDGRYYDSRKIRTSSASSTNLYSYRNILLYIFLIFIVFGFEFSFF